MHRQRGGRCAGILFWLQTLSYSHSYDVRSPHCAQAPKCEQPPLPGPLRPTVRCRFVFLLQYIQGRGGLGIHSSVLFLPCREATNHEKKERKVNYSSPRTHRNRRRHWAPTPRPPSCLRYLPFRVLSRCPSGTDTFPHSRGPKKAGELSTVSIYSLLLVLSPLL